MTVKLLGVPLAMASLLRVPFLQKKSGRYGRASTHISADGSPTSTSCIESSAPQALHVRSNVPVEGDHLRLPAL